MARSGTTWADGRSGNPSGRPKGDLARRTSEAARELGPRMIEVLAEVANDPKHPQRVQAAVAVLDRGFGRPRQSVEADITNRGPTLVEILASMAPAVRMDDDRNAEGGEPAVN